MGRIDEWITLKEAAWLMGYNADYFRRLYCDQVRPLIPIWNRRGPAGKRRVFILKSAVLSLIEGGIARPA